MTTNSGRILSLDVLRGLTICLMILVNTPGTWDHVYAPLRHASWNGVTITDLIFPMFLFIMGSSLSVSMGPLYNSGFNKQVFIKILKRSFILFLIGLFLNIIPHFEFASVRIPGVLQRIAVVYFVSALLFISTTKNVQIIITAVILIGYWTLLTYVPFNGQVPDSLTPTNNLSAYIDSSLLKGHMWSVTKTWDPEGILSTLPAITSSLTGMIISSHLKKYDYNKSSLLQLFLIGTILIIVGLIIHPFFPMNKSLWTSTYVLFTSGINIITYVLLYLNLDMKKLIPPVFTRPFMVFGTNAIASYVLSAIVAILLYSIHIGQYPIQHRLYGTLSELFSNPCTSSLVYAILFTSAIYLLIFTLYKKRIFIKI